MRRAALPEPFRVGVRPLGDDPPFRLDEDPDGARGRAAARFARDPRAVHRRLGDAGDAVDPGTLDALERAGEQTLAVVGSALTAAGLVPPSAPPPTRPSTSPSGPTPLARAALAVVEDLATLVRDASGWRLAEAFVAAPSAWVLADKIGRPLGEVHAPVPGFATGTRHDRVLTRMFDALRPGEPVRRGSWSLHADARRFLPRHAPDHAARLAATALDALYLRGECQTLHRLPGGAVLFAIDTTIRPVTALDAVERGALESQLAALTPGQRAYRGLPGAGIATLHPVSAER